jgi:hypothetical protein
MEYTVVTSNDLDKLIASVNAKIKDGWRPLGSIAVDYESSATYNQAMTRG